MSFLEINLKKLTHNYKYLRSLLDPNVRMMGVIKANAYGSLIEVIANKLITLGIEALAVAYVSEGVALRKAGIKVPILVFYPQIRSFEKIIKYKLEPAIYSKRSWLEFKKIIGKNHSRYFDKNYSRRFTTISSNLTTKYRV